jgi:hypothetical protein
MPDPQAARRLIRNARREALLVLVVWAVALAWTVGVSFLLGYQHGPQSPIVQEGVVSDRTPENFHQILGLPDWVFAGVVLPWAVSSVVTFVFCWRGIADDDLGAESAEGSEEAGHEH